MNTQEEEQFNREELYKKQVTLYLEANPNPNSMKFVANFMLVEPGASFDFPTSKDAEISGLAEALFQLDHVARVFFMSNFITITKSESVEWIEIQNKIKEVIKSWLEQEKPLFKQDTAVELNAAADDSEEVAKIKMILDEYIKPAVEQDGGAITFHSFEEGTVKVLLQGSCSGCPSSTVTLKAGIENVLKRMVPSVKHVEAEGV